MLSLPIPSALVVHQVTQLVLDSLLPRLARAPALTLYYHQIIQLVLVHVDARLHVRLPQGSHYLTRGRLVQELMCLWALVLQGQLHFAAQVPEASILGTFMSNESLGLQY